MFLQNTVHGLPTTKLEFQAVQLIWIPVRQQKKQPSKTVNKVVVMHHVKWLFGFGMVALPLLKASLVKNGLPFPAQKNPVLRKLMHYDNVERLAALNVLSLRTKAAQCRNTDIISMIQGRLNLFQPQGSDFGFYSGLTLNHYKRLDW